MISFSLIPSKLENATISLPWNRASFVRVFPVSITKFIVPGFYENYKSLKDKIRKSNNPFLHAGSLYLCNCEFLTGNIFPNMVIFAVNLLILWLK
jgi:hypothetical protein